uniref:Anaphase-promoting complex subunit 11 n=1 Tax=Meleagris gallopavo TaxID=9103 RepID=A0A803XXI3_MELGA
MAVPTAPNPEDRLPPRALKLLSCSHAYHSRCIDLWHCTQPSSKTCPLCRRRVTAVALIPLHLAQTDLFQHRVQLLQLSGNFKQKV